MGKDGFLGTQNIMFILNDKYKKRFYNQNLYLS